jgi:phage gp46-like protein
MKEMSKNPKFAIRVTEKRNGWSAEITRQVTSRKTAVSKRETGFDSEEKAQAWAEQELAGFVQNQVVRNERKAAQRQEREAEQLAAKVRKEEARKAREVEADEE